MLSACVTAQANQPVTIVTDGSAAATRVPALDPDLPVLEWEGYGVWDGDENGTKCKTLQIDANNEMKTGYCGETQAISFMNRPEFKEMVATFAPFEYETESERLIFRGRGDVASPAWQRAILAWTQWTYSESVTGRVCASCRAALSWHLGEVPGWSDRCMHLTVLNFGYTYAEILPCAGGEVYSRVAGWLETEEWERLDAWLYSRSAVYQENNYFEGMGSQSMSQAEVADLVHLAHLIYNRMNR
jgi:hypothetical protein